jgi:hypothetical protein
MQTVLWICRGNENIITGVLATTHRKPSDIQVFGDSGSPTRSHTAFAYVTQLPRSFPRVWHESHDRFRKTTLGQRKSMPRSPWFSKHFNGPVGKRGPCFNLLILFSAALKATTHRNSDIVSRKGLTEKVVAEGV